MFTKSKGPTYLLNGGGTRQGGSRGFGARDHMRPPAVVSKMKCGRRDRQSHGYIRPVWAQALKAYKSTRVSECIVVEELFHHHHSTYPLMATALSTDWEFKREAISMALNSHVLARTWLSSPNPLRERWSVAFPEEGLNYFYIFDRFAGSSKHYAQSFRLPWCEVYVPGFNAVDWIDREYRLRSGLVALFCHHAPYAGDEKEALNAQYDTHSLKRWEITQPTGDKYRIHDRRSGTKFTFHRSLAYAATPSEKVLWLRNRFEDINGR